MNTSLRCLILLTALMFSNCSIDPEPLTRKYLFLSHIYQWGVVDNNRIDYRLEGFDFNSFDQIWLGGDLCARTSEKPATLEYLDSIFDLSSETTHWTLGNHDLVNGDITLIKNITGRNTYYASFFNSIGIVVFNTQAFYHPNYQPKDHECGIIDGQLSMLQNIADTIDFASHLIILHHNPLLSDQMTGDSLNLGDIFNFYHPEYLVSCENPSTFDKVYFPLIRKIQEKGIQTVLIGGDLGQRAKAFEYRSPEGIYFLGSGINNSALQFKLPEYVTNTEPDQLLVFHHDLLNQKLTWEFVDLEELITLHKKSSAN